MQKGSSRRLDGIHVFAVEKVQIKSRKRHTLAVEHGLALYSTDGDFARFQELSWINPIPA